ncbi:MAG: HNH endonuclease [Gammaproteobacteria bacterium]|nr:HNH endonuclease [Gammaproteobacteria bacterium]MDE0650500.1 HNH endonuclease [Gammaproteobacteria bacterium]
MRDRFTRKSRTTRGSIPKRWRQEVYCRDDRVCVYCGAKCREEELTIDHMIPLAGPGLDEMTSWVTCCRACNQRKAAQPLDKFLESLAMPIEELPVSGDPIIDDPAIPMKLRALRRRIFDRIRSGQLRVSGTAAQKKLEKEYRRELWQTADGKLLEAEFPNLPGHVRAVIPQIRSIAGSEREFLLLVELAKSAQTRNLIGSVLTAGVDVEARVRSLCKRKSNPAFKKRLARALTRFERAARARGLD